MCLKDIVVKAVFTLDRRKHWMKRCRSVSLMFKGNVFFCFLFFVFFVVYYQSLKILRNKLKYVMSKFVFLFFVDKYYLSWDQPSYIFVTIWFLIEFSKLWPDQKCRNKNYINNLRCTLLHNSVISSWKKKRFSWSDERYKRSILLSFIKVNLRRCPGWLTNIYSLSNTEDTRKFLGNC